MTEEEQLQKQIRLLTNKLQVIRRRKAAMIPVASTAVGTGAAVVIATAATQSAAPVATSIGVASKAGLIGISAAGKAVGSGVAIKLTLIAGTGGLVGLVLGGVIGIIYYAHSSEQQTNAEQENVGAISVPNNLRVIQPQFNAL